MGISIQQLASTLLLGLGLVLLTGCQSGIDSGSHAGALGVCVPWPDKQQLQNAQLALASSLEEQGQTDAAIEAYTEALVKDRRCLDAHQRLGVLYSLKENYVQSEKHFQVVLAKRSDDPETLCDYAYSLYLQQRWGEAERSLRQAIELNPSHARGHNNLGLLLARTGRHDEAVVEFKQAGCDESQARLNLAHGLLWEQRWPEAERQIHWALQLNPALPSARAALALLPHDSAKPQSPPTFTRLPPAETTHQLASRPQMVR